MISKSQAKST